MASHLPGFPVAAAVAVGIGAGTVAILRLPLSAIVVATLLTGNAGAGVDAAHDHRGRRRLSGDARAVRAPGRPSGGSTGRRDAGRRRGNPGPGAVSLMMRLRRPRYILVP